MKVYCKLKLLTIEIVTCFELCRRTKFINPTSVTDNAPLDGNYFNSIHHAH